MNRGKVGLALAALGLTMISGCGLRDRPGLLSRFRARGAQPDACPCPPYMNGYGMEGFGASAMPCSMPGGGYPYPAAPGTMMPGGMMPGGMMPGGGVPEYLQPVQPGMPMPPVNPPGNGTAPGSATPKAADPSDPASLKKNGGVATTK